MENRAHALAAGIFVLLLGLAAGLFVWWLGQHREDVNYYVLETGQNVTGLNEQAQVRYRGIRAGRVESLDIDADDRRLILVRISLDARFPLSAGTQAKLNTQGVTGLAYIQLEDDGSDPRPLTGMGGAEPRIALAPPLLETLGSQAGDMAARVDVVVRRLAVLLDERNLKNVARSLDNLAAASAGLRELPATMAALRRALSDDNVQRLSGILANLEKTTGEAAPLVAETRDMIRSVKLLSVRLDRLVDETGGELNGTTLPRAHALMQEMSAAVRRLSRLIEAIDRNPQSLLFGRSKSSPAPAEP